MALNDLELSLMAFPQRWVPAGGTGGGTLQLNVLLLPVGDPTQPLGSGPLFAGTAVPVVANLSGPGALPSTGTAPTLTSQLVLTPPPVAPTLFAQLAQQFATAGITLTSGKLATVSGARIKKSLPASYTNAIPFEGPASGDVQVGDGYGCALRAQAPGINQPPPGTDQTIAWGQVLSYALRQPALAQRLGLIYPVSIAVPAVTLAAGGFVYVTLDASNPGNPWVADQQANPDTVRSYAARLPALAASGRPLFAATLLPVVSSPGSNLTQAQFEAAEYDDGFAQVVHGNQPTTIDAATLQPDRITPGSDAGIQVGWDDEQVTAWLNGQLDLLRFRVAPSPGDNPPETPLGVHGYRVDVRVAGQQAWASLCAVKGTLPLNDTGYGSGAMTSIDGELWVAPAPIRPSQGAAPANDGNDEDAWLPLYFAQWAGASLVLPDPAVQLLAAGWGPDPVTVPGTVANPRPDLSGVPALRYGTDYEFRVRLVDLSGGGPDASAAPVHPGPVPATLARFRRYVTPKALLVDTHENLQPYPAVPPAVRDIQTLTVRRPQIGYPEALFAGVDPATFAPASLAALINAAKNNGGVLDIADPDVDSFDVIVEARIPAHDTGPAGTDPGDVDGNFRVVYSVNVPFGAGADPSVTLTLNYTDGIDDISTVEPPAAGTTTLPIPTARDIRVRLQPQCADKPDYYGTDSPPTGPYSDYIVRQAAMTEDTLFSGSAASQLSALYFQPGSNIPQLLGQQLGVAQNALTLTGQPGQRTVFGASGALRHTVSADGGSITFSNQTELLGHWIVAITLQLERDWTWDGFAQPAAAMPGQSLTSAVPSLGFSRDSSPIGAITVPRIIAASTLADPSVAADRSGTRIIFFDAIDPNPAPGAFPAELSPGYTVTAAFEKAAAQTLPLQVTLPITTPPAQTPKIVATGLAESPYAAASDYSSTSPRDRFLWIEFDQPIADPEDCYFGRVLAYGPDPLLAFELAPTPDLGAMLPESPAGLAGRP